jgi:hypothetical protein
MNEILAPAVGEVTYLYEYDEVNDASVFTIVTHGGASIRMTMPVSAQAEMDTLVLNFHEHVLEMGRQFMEYQNKWYAVDFVSEV